MNKNYPERRNFLKSIGLLIGSGMVGVKGISVPASRSVREKLKGVNVPFTRTVEQKYVELGKKIGIGHAKVTFPEKVEVSSWSTVEILYTAGKAGIKPGGGIRLTMMHLHRWLPFQCEDPQAPGFVSAIASNGISLKLKCFVNRSWAEILPSRELRLYDPYYNYVQVVAVDSVLDPGATIRLILGDKSQGSPGVFTQYYTEDKFRFETYVNPDGKDIYYPFPENGHPMIEVFHGETFRINIVTPSHALRGERSWCIIRAEDRFGNPVSDFSGTIKVSGKESNKTFFDHTFTPGEKGAFRYDFLRFEEEGVFRLIATCGSWTSISNPVIVSDRAQKENLYWGDIHNHARFSDGRGNLDQSYQYGRDFAGLDFCAITEHAQNLKDHEWEDSIRVTNAFNIPGKFVTFHGYEWSGKEDTGGDHNVYFPDEIPPRVYRSRANFNYENFNNYQGQEMQMNHIEDLYIALMQHFTHKNIIVIPHYGGRKGNPLWHYPVLERMIEVYSDHRRSEDWVTSYLNAGHRVGIMASSDNHVGKPGYSITFPRTGTKQGEKWSPVEWEKEKIGTSLMAVYANQHSRESIFEAIYDRRCYATSGARIILNFQLNGKPMGSEIKLDRPPVIKTEVTGTTIITRIEIKKNSHIVHVTEPNKSEVAVEWTDPVFDPEESAHYYIRVVQADLEEAISSPVWVN